MDIGGVKPDDGLGSGDSGVYDLTDDLPVAPDLPGSVAVTDGLDTLIDTLAADLVLHAENCVREFGDFHLALSGGPVPEPLYKRLMYDPNYRRLPWKRTHLWLVADSIDPISGQLESYPEIAETIADHADIPAEQVHPIDVASPTGDRDYESLMQESLGWREKGQDRLDFILLTMADDGSTAGLFPGSDVLDEPVHFFRFAHHPDASHVRWLTMTHRLINAARFIAVMAPECIAHPVIQRLESREYLSGELPIADVSPLNGELKWYLS